MYRLFLVVNNNQSTLQLLKSDVMILEKKWPEERDMGKQLLSALKGILDESGVDPSDITEFILEGDARENFTSRRIAETVQKTFLFATKAI